MPEESNISNESDDVGEGGFVFFKLGRVEVLFVEEDEEVHTLQDAWEGYWMDTKFCAVMRITKGDSANRVYLFYDFHAPEDVTGNRFPKDDSGYWGYPGEGTKQFSCARIADRLSDLELFKPLSLTEVVDRPVEIVRAMMTAQRTIIRATVA